MRLSDTEKRALLATAEGYSFVIPNPGVMRKGHGYHAKTMQSLARKGLVEFRAFRDYGGLHAPVEDTWEARITEPGKELVAELKAGIEGEGE